MTALSAHLPVHALTSWLVYPFSEARRLPNHVAHEPLSAHEHPVPRPSVLGRTIVAADCVSWPTPLRVRRSEDTVDSIELSEC